MPDLVVASDKDETSWNEYFHHHPRAHFYYDFRWKDVFRESFGSKCFYLMAKEGGRVAGILPLVLMESRIMSPCLVSLPFLNYGGILADSDEAASFLLNNSVRLARELKAKYIEMRDLGKLGFFPETREHKVTMWLTLENSVEAQWLKLNAKIRNEVRKAEKSGLAIKTGKDELLDSFYKVFSRNMRDLGTPVIGKIFFKNILKHFPEESGIFITTLHNKPIAAAFSLSHNNSMEAPWASSIKEYNRTCPNEFIYWHMIKHAIEKKADRFDFGRCTKDSGTYRFKKQWAPEEKQLYWQYWESDGFRLPPEDPKKGRFGLLIQLWKRLPLCVANSIGPGIARHLTTF